MRYTRRENMSATSLAQVSQYLRSPHFSTIFAKFAPGARSSGGNGNSGASGGTTSSPGPPPLKMIRFGGVSFRSILLISASNRSSCERNARSTLQTRRTARCRREPLPDRRPPARRWAARYSLTACPALSPWHGLRPARYRLGCCAGSCTAPHRARARRSPPTGTAHSAGPFGIAFQPLDPRVAVQSVMLAIDMACLAPECGRQFRIREQPHGLTDDAVPMRLQPFGGLDGVRKRDCPAQGLDRPVARALFSGFCNARQHPAIFAASVRVISPPPAARCPCNAASTWLSDIARTTTL